MATSHLSTPTTRRNVIAGASALAFTFPTAGTAEPIDDHDAELIAIGEELQIVVPQCLEAGRLLEETEQRSVDLRPGPWDELSDETKHRIETESGHAEAEADWSALYNRADALVIQSLPLRASTVKGHAAKALAFDWSSSCVCDGLDGEGDEADAIATALIESLCAAVGWTPFGLLDWRRDQAEQLAAGSPARWFNLLDSYGVYAFAAMKRDDQVSAAQRPVGFILREYQGPISKAGQDRLAEWRSIWQFDASQETAMIKYLISHNRMLITNGSEVLS